MVTSLAASTRTMDGLTRIVPPTPIASRCAAWSAGMPF